MGCAVELAVAEPRFPGSGVDEALGTAPSSFFALGGWSTVVTDCDKDFHHTVGMGLGRLADRPATWSEMPMTSPSSPMTR